MVLYFREREAHDRTKQELAELRAAQQKAQEQRAEEHRLFLEQQAEGPPAFLGTNAPAARRNTAAALRIPPP